MTPLILRWCCRCSLVTSIDSRVLFLYLPPQKVNDAVKLVVCLCLCGVKELTTFYYPEVKWVSMPLFVEQELLLLSSCLFFVFVCQVYIIEAFGGNGAHRCCLWGGKKNQKGSLVVYFFPSSNAVFVLCSFSALRSRGWRLYVLWRHSSSLSRLFFLCQACNSYLLFSFSFSFEYVNGEIK